MLSSCLALFYLPLLLILLLSFVWEAASTSIIDNKAVENEDLITRTDFENDQHNYERTDDASALPSPTFVMEDNLLVLHKDHLMNVTSLQEQLGLRFLILMVVYDDSINCSSSREMLQRVQESAILWNQQQQHEEEETSRSNRHVAATVWAKIHIDELQDVVAVPSLLFLTVANDDKESTLSSLVMLEYNGLATSAHDIYDTVLHYSWRLLDLSQGLRLEETFITPDLIQLHNNMESVISLMSRQQNVLRQLLQTSSLLKRQHPLVRIGTMASINKDRWNDQTTEFKYMEWLLKDDGNRMLEKEDFTIFVLWKRGQQQQDELTRAFEQVARVISNRRDCVFLLAGNCDVGDEGGDDDESNVNVFVYTLPISTLLLDKLEVSLSQFWPEPLQFMASSAEALTEFVVTMATPSVLGFDRQLTAPIAFPLYRKVHAVLFVNMHGLTGNNNIEQDNTHTWEQNQDDLIQREIVQGFYRMCQQERRVRQYLEREMVCLIVTSLETRILNAFGVDYWTPLDRQLFQDLYAELENDGNQEIEWPETKTSFPVLLLTDQRHGGTRRYYLDGPRLRHDPEITMTSFVADFWASRLAFERKSDRRGPRSNKANIRIVTATSLVDELSRRNHESHSLIVFTAPTCGHCKRFKTIYNQLGELLVHVGWDKTLLTLYEVDVTKNDLLDVDGSITVKWLPDLYYIPPLSSATSNDNELAKDWIVFNDTDTRGDGAGSLNDAVEILDWFLNLASLPKDVMQNLLTSLSEV